MTFQIHALDYAPFAALFDLSDAALAERGARRVRADADPGYPCRVSLRDAAVGEELILTNYRHLDVASPYAATHAIFVRKGAIRATPRPGALPQVLTRRVLSLRAFDMAGFMAEADITDGAGLRHRLEAMLAGPGVAFVDIHNAKQGCFAARATRAAVG
ncbi:DUF1203 domain-containing protein [Actibacterium ureilyticum]|uniref:DUF1203 domain-containing protein n=1 Tax=Actibacterium ureilyticum TaxID=1590614 RepID=UPI000BAB0602|nr:DUF1203 domain-containing protein [Actibacterium ureilyticum]